MSPGNRSAFASAARGGGGPRKSPLRLAADPVPVVSAGSSRGPDVLAGGGFRRADLSPAQRRQVMISEYGEWLRSQTNRHGRPFQPETISAYRTVVAEAARFPELGEVFYANGACRLLDRLERFFATAMESGLLRPTHPRCAAEQFVGLVRGDLMLRALLGISRNSDVADTEAIVASGVDTFCRAYLSEGGNSS